MAGLVVGIIRMAVEFSFPGPRCGSHDVDNRPDIISKVHYLMFAIILAAVSLVATLAITIVTAPRRKNQVSHRQTYKQTYKQTGRDRQTDMLSVCFSYIFRDNFYMFIPR